MKKKESKQIEEAQGLISMFNQGYLLGYLRAFPRRKPSIAWAKIRDQARKDFEKLFMKGGDEDGRMENRSTGGDDSTA